VSGLAPVTALLTLVPGLGAAQGASPEPPGSSGESGQTLEAEEALRAAEETARLREAFPTFVWRGGEAP
jgi:hypothetical protein